MQNQSEERDKKKPEVGQTPVDKRTREKEISITQQSSDEPMAEKSVPRQQKGEIQNPLMHESY